MNDQVVSKGIQGEAMTVAVTESESFELSEGALPGRLMVPEDLMAGPLQVAVRRPSTQSRGMCVANVR